MSPLPSPEQLARWRKLAEGIFLPGVKGEVRPGPKYSGLVTHYEFAPYDASRKADADFHAEARTMAPALLDGMEEARETVRVIQNHARGECTCADNEDCHAKVFTLCRAFLGEP